MKTIASHLPSQVLTFVRHGATEPNLAGLRCGGDLDVALSATGRTQALSAAKQLRALGWPVGAIVCSDLQRTRETAHIIKDSFPYVDLMIAPGFAERHLGSWNLLPISQTEDELNAGATPPGGESREAFFDRITTAIENLLPRISRLPYPPLLVASKGVARVLSELQMGRMRPDALVSAPIEASAQNSADQPGETHLNRGANNGELIRFELTFDANHSAQRCIA